MFIEHRGFGDFSLLGAQGFCGIKHKVCIVWTYLCNLKIDSQFNKMPLLIYIYKRPLRKKILGQSMSYYVNQNWKKSISIIKSINIMRHNLILYSFLFPLLISYRPRERNQVYFVRPDVISTKSFNVKIIKYYQKNLCSDNLHYKAEAYTRNPEQLRAQQCFM